MANSDDPSGRIRQARFGPYEVNFDTGELRKYGLRVKLQEKPFRVLQALLERPGELLTREELRDRLWPKDLYVDFERNLTIAMNKLRTALRDSAERPRYIETLPRRGYRFVAAVEPVNGDKTNGARTAPHSGANGDREIAGEAAMNGVVSPIDPAETARRPSMRQLAVAGALLVLCSRTQCSSRSSKIARAKRCWTER